MKQNKVLISLFDRTENMALAFGAKGWTIKTIDIQTGTDILTWDYVSWFNLLCVNRFPYAMPEVGIVAQIPCDDYALCGNRHKNTPKRKVSFKVSQQLVAKTKEIIDYFDNIGILNFYMIENPMSDIHKKNPWLGEIRQKFNPCDFAGYDPIPDNSRYNKMTWLWGKFNKMIPKPMPPLQKDNPGWKKYGGRSLATKNARSVVPLGYCNAFADANSYYA